MYQLRLRSRRVVRSIVRMLVAHITLTLLLVIIAVPLSSAAIASIIAGKGTIAIGFVEVKIGQTSAPLCFFAASPDTLRWRDIVEYMNGLIGQGARITVVKNEKVLTLVPEIGHNGLEPNRLRLCPPLNNTNLYRLITYNVSIVVAKWSHVYASTATNQDVVAKLLARGVDESNLIVELSIILQQFPQVLLTSIPFTLTAYATIAALLYAILRRGWDVRPSLRALAKTKHVIMMPAFIGYTGIYIIALLALIFKDAVVFAISQTLMILMSFMLISLIVALMVASWLVTLMRNTSMRTRLPSKNASSSKKLGELVEKKPLNKAAFKILLAIIVYVLIAVVVGIFIIYYIVIAYTVIAELYVLQPFKTWTTALIALLPAALNVVLQARGKGIEVRPETVLIVFYVVATASLAILTLDPIFLLLTPTEQSQVEALFALSIIAVAAIATAYTAIYPPQGDGSPGLWTAAYLVVLIVVLIVKIIVADPLPSAEEAIRAIVVLLSLAYFYAYPYLLADLACQHKTEVEQSRAVQPNSSNNYQ